MSLSSYLQSVRSRAEKATMGPWYVDGSEVRFDYDSQAFESARADCSVQICNLPRIGPLLDPRAGDREFIAHSRTDIEKLLAIVETQRKALEYCSSYSNTKKGMNSFQFSGMEMAMRHAVDCFEAKANEAIVECEIITAEK